MTRAGMVVAVVFACAACSSGSTGPDGTAAAPASTTSSTASERVAPRRSTPPPPVVGPASSPPIRVGPDADHPLATIDRDVGLSVRLTDGSRLWLYGDTAAREADERLSYFEVGTGAWAPADEPTTTQDAVRDGAPLPLIADESVLPPCPSEAPRRGVWPVAAVTDPQDPNRVIIWMTNTCLGSATTVRPQGISVGEWRYNPAEPPQDTPIQITVLNPKLFDTATDAGAALLSGDGINIDVLACRPPSLAGWGRPVGSGRGPQPIDGSCAAKRVRADEVADPNAYRTWDGADWGSGPAAPISLPVPTAPPNLPAVPIGPFSVAPAPGGQGYVMVYSPWPGWVPVADIRFADRITGPWSPPVSVQLPGCDRRGDVKRSCYAANVQPDFSTPTELGVGFYDREVSAPPQRGSFLITRVPFRAQ